MGVSLCIWPMTIGLLGLLSASSVHGRGDTFDMEHAEEDNLEEAVEPPDDILDINLGLILPEAPESSFLMEGDIIKMSPYRLFSSANPRWPKKKGIVQIPYLISYRYDQSSLKIIKEAFQDFAQFTCIKFVPYSYQRDFISIAPLSGCFSSVGRIGGMQVVSLAPACLRRGKGVALHELMHVLGFWHEHSRADRDKYISISWNEILTGFEMNFMKSWNTNMLGDYDYSSVMHYGRNAFSMTGLPTIIPLSSPNVFLGQRWNLSRSDIARVNKLYKCSQVAAEPEISTERVVKEKMMDFIPSEPQPCSNESQVETSTAWSPYTTATSREAPGATLFSSRTAGEGVIALEAQTERAWPSGTEMQKENVVTPKTSSKAEESGEFLGATAETPHKNQSREMEAPKVVNAAPKISVSPALQNPTSRAGELRRQSPSYKETYLPKEQSPTEARTKATLELEFPLSFLSKGPVPLSTEVVQGATMRPGPKGAGGEQFGMTEVALSTAVEMRGTLVTQSGESGHANGSPSPSEIYSFSMVENQPTGQPKEAFRQTISISENKSGRLAYTPPLMGSTETKPISALYRMLSPKNSPSSFVGLREEETLATEAVSPASSAIIPNQMGMMGKEVEGSQSKEQSAPAYLWSTTSRKEYGENKLEHRVFPSEEAQRTHLGWRSAGIPSSSWSAVTGQLVPSRLKEGTASESRPTGLSAGMGAFSYPPAHQGRKEYGWEAFAKSTPPEAVLLHVTEPEIVPEEQMPARSEWPSQAPTLWKMGSLAVETMQATPPSERPSLARTAGERLRASQSQPSYTKGYGPSALTAGQGPSATVQGEESESALETASITATERPTMGQKISFSQGEELGTGPPRETKAHGRATLWRLFSTEPFSSQVPIQLGQQLVRTQWQPSPTLSIETASPGEGKFQVQTMNPNKQGTTVISRLCGGKLSVSLPETKPPSTEQTSKRGVSPDMGLKLGATGREIPGPEMKEHASTLEGASPPMGETGTTPSGVSKSSRVPERNRMGNYTDFDKEETSSAEIRTLPHKRTPEKTKAHGQGTPPTMHIGASHVSSTPVLSKSALKRSQNSYFSWETESLMNPDSPSPQSLEPAAKSQVASQPDEMISTAEGRPAKPRNATEKSILHRMNWAATLARGRRNRNKEEEQTG